MPEKETQLECVYMAIGHMDQICFSVCQILQTGPYLKKDGRKTGIFLTKIRALDGRKDGRRRAKFKFLFLKKRVNSTRDSSLGYTG